MAEAAKAISTGSFKAAHASGADWSAAVRACLSGLEPLPARANLGFIYITDPLADDMSSIVTFLREKTGIEDWVGTVGLGIAASGVEHYEEPAMAVLVGALPEGRFRVFEPLYDDLNNFMEAHGAWVAEHLPILGVVHGDPRNKHIVELVDGLARETSAFLVGGLSASRGAYPQLAGKLSEGGLSGLLFAAQQLVVSGLTQGCTPIGPVHEITACEDNVIIEIDGRPALDVLREDIGELLARDLRRIDGYIFAAFPILGSDTGDYLVRNLLAIDLERGWVSVGEQIESGRSIQFARRDHGSAQQDLQRMLDDVVRRAGDAPKAAIY